MASWWESTVPAVSALAGVSIAVVAQGLTERRKHREALRERLFAEKKDAYAEFGRVAWDIRVAMAPIFSAAGTVDPTFPDRLAAVTDEMTAQSQYLATVDPADSLAVLDAMQRLDTAMERQRAVLDERRPQSEAIAASGPAVEHMAKLGALRAIIDLYGSPQVRAAVEAVIRAVGPDHTDEQLHAARERFIAAARRDLGITSSRKSSG